jgi:hypothetical protein
LVNNWTKQAATFYSKEALNVKVWSPGEWNSDQKTPGTVWIIKESYLMHKVNARGPDPQPTPFWKVFGDSNFSSTHRLLSTFADEGHLAWRSDTSTRSDVYKNITANSEFNVILSGTMFPMGPEEDGRRILEHLGGSLSKEDVSGKWEGNLKLAFRRLLGLESKKSPGYWDVLSFRILISQFYVRRTAESFWQGRWIVSKLFERPTPRIILPNKDAFTELRDP